MKNPTSFEIASEIRGVRRGPRNGGMTVIGTCPLANATNMMHYMPHLRVLGMFSTAGLAFGLATAAAVMHAPLHVLPPAYLRAAWSMMCARANRVCLQASSAAALSTAAVACLTKSPMWMTVCALNTFVPLFTLVFMDPRTNPKLLPNAAPATAADDGFYAHIHHWMRLDMCRLLASSVALGLVVGDYGNAHARLACCVSPSAGRR